MNIEEETILYPNVIYMPNESHYSTCSTKMLTENTPCCCAVIEARFNNPNTTVTVIEPK